MRDVRGLLGRDGMESKWQGERGVCLVSGYGVLMAAVWMVGVEGA